MSLFHPFDQLSEGQKDFRFAQKWIQKEKEYEIVGRVEDERDYSSWATRVQLGFGVWPGLTFRIGGEYAYEGVLRKTFDPSLTFANERVQYKGMRHLSLSAQYFSEKKNLAFELYAKANPFHSKDTNDSLGGYDEGMAFKYLHHFENFLVYGKVFVEISGKKRLVRYDGIREITDPYTKFGNELNIRHDFGSMWVSLGGHFLLTTDLVTRSSNYNRSSDKGFGIGGTLELGLDRRTWGMRLWHSRSSEVFNVINDDPGAQTEYEIEAQDSGLEVSWFW